MEYFDPDIHLMLEFQKGNETCFVTLVERQKQRVFNLAFRFMGNYQEAEDITQEVFINIYKAKEKYQPKAKFTTWLYTITKNTCLKKLRKKNPSTVSMNETMELSENSVTRQFEDKKTPSPLDAALSNEQAAIIKKAVDALPTNQRLAVLLCRYEGLSYDEAAQVIDCTESSVKSLLHRAKINLKDLLKNSLYFPQLS
ncbi:MAG: RNA polymerase sigma factor [Alphaproteobacteria bacterium]|nr:RNA polymerase sigma factor [Alphaproteobacteria bacterium]